MEVGKIKTLEKVEFWKNKCVIQDLETPQSKGEKKMNKKIGGSKRWKIW